ncbi:MAG: 3-deoxy-D-manno-octulosonic acid kinase [Thiohalospira sp.]
MPDQTDDEIYQRDPDGAGDGGGVILHDGRLGAVFPAELFRPESAAIRGGGTGRGEAAFLSATRKTEAGEEAVALVLRHFRRGGLLGRMLGDRYIRNGLARSRPVREWRLMRELRRQGLPVPAPVAVRVAPRGLIYRGDLITERLEGAVPLADLLEAGNASLTLWQVVGATIARFHAAGAWHADLNVRNILVDEGSGVWLIDWDRGRLGVGRAGPLRANLRRLRRSLDKEVKSYPAGSNTALLERSIREGWPALERGYHRGAGNG